MKTGGAVASFICVAAGLTNEPTPDGLSNAEKVLSTEAKVGFYCLAFKLRLEVQPTLNPSSASTTSAAAPVAAIAASVGAVIKNGINASIRDIMNRSKSRSI